MRALVVAASGSFASLPVEGGIAGGFWCGVAGADQGWPGVLFSYQGLGTVIHRDSVIEDGAVISTCVTLGGRGGRIGAPHIGRGALIGAGAKVLGPVRIGAFASIGANAVVTSDVPDFGVAVGVPVRVVRINRPDQVPDYHRFD